MSRDDDTAALAARMLIFVGALMLLAAFGGAALGRWQAVLP